MEFRIILETVLFTKSLTKDTYVQVKLQKRYEIKEGIVIAYHS